MISTQTFIRSAYFSEVRDSLAFLKCLEPVIKEVQLPMGVRRCIPIPKTIASKLEIPKGEVEREIERLMNLKWARKYSRDNKVLFVIGNTTRLYMSHQVQKMFSKARRKKDGGVMATEWKWLPLEKWSGVTLWQMVRDKLWQQEISAAIAQIKGRSQMQRLIVEVGITTAKEVADFFAAQFETLKVHFKWYGIANPGLFKGFFHSIHDIKRKGFPQPKGMGHNRGNESALAETLVEEKWSEF